MKVVELNGKISFKLIESNIFIRIFITVKFHSNYVFGQLFHNNQFARLNFSPLHFLHVAQCPSHNTSRILQIRNVNRVKNLKNNKQMKWIQPMNNLCFFIVFLLSFIRSFETKTPTNIKRAYDNFIKNTNLLKNIHDVAL